MQVTKHFTREEFEHSETGIRLGLPNSVPADKVEAMTNTLTHMEVLREYLNSEELKPKNKSEVAVILTSGYRNLRLNRLIGSKDDSQHIKCEAVDSVATGFTVKEYYNTIRKLVNEGKFTVDQCIIEYNRWVHLSFKLNSQENRKMFFSIG